jgi:iron complex outermembrane receptor protein
MASSFTYAFPPRAARCDAIHGALLLCLSLLTTQVHASDTSHRTCAAPEPLEAALLPLAQRAQVTITYDSLSARLNVCPVTGEADIATALEQMLAGSGLIAVRTGERSYAVRRAPVIQGPAMPSSLPAGVEGTSDSADTLTVRGVRIVTPPITPATVIFNTYDHDQSGLATVGDSLARASGQVTSLPEFVWGDGAQFADVRGVGIDFTTVRIDQGWLAPTATSGVAFDLNAMPLSFVERAEVLDEMQAARRGLRALGGNIEIDLKKSPPSPVAWLAVGGAAGGGMQRQVAASLGIDEARWSVGLWLDYFDRDELPGRSRDFWRDQNFSAHGGLDYRSRASWPGNIRSTTGAPLPGLSSLLAAVPVDTSGRAPEIGDFQATAGEYRLDSLRRFSSILPATERRSLRATLQGKFQNVTPFIDLMGVWRDSAYQYPPPTLVDALVPASNAFNPFDQPVYVSRLLLEIEPRQVFTASRWWRFVSGLRGQVGAWQWYTSLSRSEEFVTRRANHALNEPRVAAALASSDPATALNVFQAGPVGDSQLVSSLVLPSIPLDFRSLGTSAAANLSGPVFALPAGEVMASFNAEWRDERSVAMRTVATMQAGLDIPLWVDALDAHVSTRWDRFHDLGEIVTSSYALQSQPWRGFELHASHASQFRIPSLLETFGPSYEIEALVSDRRRGGEVRPVTVYGGSTAELALVRGDSTSFGFTVSPVDLPELTLQGDYWLKRMHSRIMALPLSLLMEHEAEFAGLIVRDAATFADQAAGRPGVIRSVNISTTHVGGIEASGIDMSVAYRFFRSVDTSLTATWMDELSVRDVPHAASTNRLGVAHPRGTIPRWRAALSIRWKGELASAALHARYVGSYSDMVGNRPAGRKLQPQAFVDLQASINLEAIHTAFGLLRGVSLTAGALNLFDRSPQYSAAGLDVGFDASLSDPRQRFSFLRLEKRF